MEKYRNILRKMFNVDSFYFITEDNGKVYFQFCSDDEVDIDKNIGYSHFFEFTPETNKIRIVHTLEDLELTDRIIKKASL